MFSWTSRNSRTYQTMPLKNIRVSFLATCKFASSVTCLCVLWVGSAETTTSRRQNTLSSSWLSWHVRSLRNTERKMCVRLSRCGESFWERVYLWRQQAHLCRHAQIELYVRGLLGNRYFFYRSISFLMLLYFLISFWF